MTAAIYALLLAEHAAVKAFIACDPVNGLEDALALSDKMVHAHQAAAEALAVPVVHHGADCRKAVHDPKLDEVDAYGHPPNDDGPYLLWCGRCHEVLA